MVAFSVAGNEPFIIHAVQGLQEYIPLYVVFGLNSCYLVVDILSAYQLVIERFTGYTGQAVACIRYMVCLRHTVTEPPDSLHDLCLRVYHRIRSAEYVRQYNDIRFIIQFDVHRRVETTGKEIHLSQLRKVIAHFREILPFEFLDTFFATKDFAPSLQFERLNKAQCRVCGVQKNAGFFVLLVEPSQQNPQYPDRIIGNANR